MELFEILFILFFILIPVLEGIRKSRQRRDTEGPDVGMPTARRPPGAPREAERADRPDRYEPSTRGPSGPEPRSAPEPVEAADMIPDDLWEILTGERRERPRTEPREEPEEPWVREPHWEPAGIDMEVEEAERFEPEPWFESMPDEVEEVREAPPPAPPSPAPPLISPTPRAPAWTRPATGRRRLAQEEPGEPGPREPDRTRDLIRSLRQPETLRQAVLLKEILDRPKGFEF